MGLLETIFSQLNFKALVFGTFEDLSSNVGGLMVTLVEYGVKHLGTNMAVTTVDTVRDGLRWRYKT